MLNVARSAQSLLVAYSLFGLAGCKGNDDNGGVDGVNQGGTGGLTSTGGTTSVPLGGSGGTSTSNSAATAGTAVTCERVISGYYVYWEPTYRAAQLPLSKLTHVAHAFVWPKADGSLEIPSTYLEPELITRAHAVGTKVLVSIGGAGTEPDAGFRSVAATETLRSIFATNLASFVKTYGYDGVDLDWESPQSALDRDNFTRLITELRKALPRPVLFTMAVGGTNWFGQWLDYAAIDSMIDYYNLMAYDQHGGWEGTAGHNAAIYVSGEADSSLNDQYFVEYLTTTRNLSARKVVLGVPFYGYRYDGSTTLGDDCGGDCSTAVSVAYKDVGPLIGNGWTRHWDATARVPWLTRDGAAGLIAYDDPESMDAKVHWALETRNLAGVFTWELSEDTVNGETPLFDAMRRSYDVVCP